MSTVFSKPVLGRVRQPCEQIVAELMGAPLGTDALDTAYKRFGIGPGIPDILFSLDPFRAITRAAGKVGALGSRDAPQPAMVESAEDRRICNRALAFVLLKRGQTLPEAADDDAGAVLDDGRFRLISEYGNDVLLYGPECSVFLAPCDPEDYRRNSHYKVQWLVFWELPSEQALASQPVADAGPEVIIDSERIPSWTRGLQLWRSQPWPQGRHLILCRIQATDHRGVALERAAYYSSTISVMTPQSAMSAKALGPPRTPKEWAEAQKRYRDLIQQIAEDGPAMEPDVSDVHAQELAALEQSTEVADALWEQLETQRIRACPIDAWWFASDHTRTSRGLNDSVKRHLEARCRGEGSNTEADFQPVERRMLLLARGEGGRSRWALLDWTELRIEAGALRGTDYDRVLRGSFDSFTGSIDDAVLQWDAKNRLRPGLLALRVPPGVEGLGAVGSSESVWTLETRGSTHIDSLRVSTGVGMVAVLAASVIFPPAVLASGLAASSLALANGVMGIYQNMDHGVREWTPYALDGLMIVASCLRLISAARQAGQSVRGGRAVRLSNGVQVRDPVQLSVVGVEGIESLVIAQDHYSKIREIVDDASKTPSERLVEVGQYLAPFIAARQLALGVQRVGARRIHDSQTDQGTLVVPGNTQRPRSPARRPNKDSHRYADQGRTSLVRRERLREKLSELPTIRADELPLLSTTRAGFRRDVEKAIKSVPDHDLKFLLTHEGRLRSGTGKGITGLEWLEMPEMVDAAHVLTAKWLRGGGGGRERFMIMSTWHNRRLSATIEHPAKGAYMDVGFAIEIGGLPVHVETALDWVSKGLLTEESFVAARKIVYP